MVQVILVMYGSLYGGAVFTSWFASCSVWQVPAYYVVGMVVFYAWHYLAHSEAYHAFCKARGWDYLAELHEIHMEHHLDRFPPGDFYGSAKLFNEMYPDGKPTIWNLMDLTKTTSIGDGTALSKELSKKPASSKSKAKNEVKAHSMLAHEWPMISAQLTLITLCGAGVFPGGSGRLAACVFLLYFLMSAVGNALHMSFHVRNLHLETYAWYRELRTMHYIHHLGDMKSNMAMLNLGIDSFFGSMKVGDPLLASQKQRKAAVTAPRGTAIDTEASTGGFYAALARTSPKDLPAGITREGILGSVAHAGLSAAMMGLDLPVDPTDSQAHRTRHPSHGKPTVTVRLVLAYAGLAAWRAAALDVATDSSVDPGHALLAPVGAWLLEEGTDRAATACACCNLGTELLALGLLVSSVAGPSFRPALTVMLVFGLRLALSVLGAVHLVLPPPSASWPADEAGWGLPAFFVRPGSAGFFNARVALWAVASLECLAHACFKYAPLNKAAHRVDATRASRALAAVAAVALLAFVVGLTLALKVAWTCDVAIALLAARYASIIADRHSPFVDSAMPHS